MKNRTLWICTGVGTIGLATVAVLAWYLSARQADQAVQSARKQQERAEQSAREKEEREADLANEVVRARLEAARAHLARRDFDAALTTLRDTKGTEKATKKDALEPLLTEAEKGQAAALFESAVAALQRREPDAALKALAAFLAHPHCTERDRALALQAEVHRATDDGQAIAFLRATTDARLDHLGDADAALTADDNTPVRDERVRPLFLDTVRRHLPAEVQRRTALRVAERANAERLARERVERETKVRESEAYRQVASLVAGVRAQYRREREAADKQNKLLDRMFQELRITDEEEKAEARKLYGIPSKRDEFRKLVEDSRAQARKQAGGLESLTPAEREMFTQMIDQLTDELLTELKKSDQK
jgi:hypothetical protein